MIERDSQSVSLVPAVITDYPAVPHLAHLYCSLRHCKLCLTSERPTGSWWPPSLHPLQHWSWRITAEHQPQSASSRGHTLPLPHPAPWHCHQPAHQQHNNNHHLQHHLKHIIKLHLHSSWSRNQCVNYYTTLAQTVLSNYCLRLKKNVFFLFSVEKSNLYNIFKKYTQTNYSHNFSVLILVCTRIL